MKKNSKEEYLEVFIILTENTATLPKPQKVLKFNRATGTIGSPPKPPIPQPDAKKQKTRRRRKAKTFMVSISYGQDGDDASRLETGHQINDLLDATKDATITTTTTTPPKNGPNILSEPPLLNRDNDEQLTNEPNICKQDSVERAPQSSSCKGNEIPKKPTHPFFQGSSKLNNATEVLQKPETKPPREKQVFFGPASSASRNPRPAPSRFSLPTPGMSSGILKVPGARHPTWPSKETAHVRGDTLYPLAVSDNTRNGQIPKKRKAKGQQVRIADSESILHHTAMNLKLKQTAEELKVFDNGDFQPPPPSLRIPQRHFESGKNLQARISTELKTIRRNNGPSKTHPAITFAHDSIRTGLSAFDMSTCETTAWAQKYAPSSAERVLQSGREAELLRSWLENLKVLSVDTGGTDSGTKPKAVALVKGKGKRKKKLDGFIVSSDDEADELGEISDVEEDWGANRIHGSAKKTFIRPGSSRQKSRDGGRFTNAVVLSGPHGCGKTASIYAIAKELDFEIFEINSGARRNGKDIMEKVGDMTRNHLVQHQHKDDTPQEEEVSEDEVERDLKSGKQGRMTAFFKPNAAAPQKSVKKSVKKPIKKPTESLTTNESKKSPKSQKQSLILLEEVDVLYEEDKQFWATIISMISQSKRPFIMTCNDEAQVPLQSLNLHGIFRFSSPPKDLAVDYLLLIAANEGHALRRPAIEALYDSRKHDLRASITELNYWCQIGVGDVQGGFNWFYPRWPKGSDIDEEGHAIRVVSQDTYQPGMGWLSRDSAINNLSSQSCQEELRRQVFQHWSLDAYELGSNCGFSSWATAATNQRLSKKERLTLLEAVDSFSSFASDADIGVADFSAIPTKSSMDASIPSLSSKAREDFIIGRQLIEASPLVRYDTMRFDIATSLKDLSRALLGGAQPIHGAPDIFKPLDEVKATSILTEHFDESLYVEPPIARLDFSCAFDPIAASEKTMAAGYLDPSVFDGTMKTISLDIAPYVRSIVAYDQRLQRQRLARSSLLSEGGQPGKKRMRTTRSSYSALEGGSRASARRDKYFSADVNPHLVLRTGGKGWDAITTKVTSECNSKINSGADDSEDSES